jgi:hypothetical protein
MPIERTHYAPCVGGNDCCAAKWMGRMAQQQNELESKFRPELQNLPCLSLIVHNAKSACDKQGWLRGGCADSPQAGRGRARIAQALLLELRVLPLSATSKPNLQRIALTHEEQVDSASGRNKQDLHRNFHSLKKYNSRQLFPNPQKPHLLTKDAGAFCCVSSSVSRQIRSRQCSYPFSWDCVHCDDKALLS